MKKIRLTYDIETVTTGFSLNADPWHAVLNGAIYLARALEERGLKATFFVSLSRKTSQIDRKEFDLVLETLLSSLRGFSNIRLQPHIHAYDLPVGFKCPSDFFSDYTLDQQAELLAYAKGFFARHGLEATAFRPGGYHLTDEYYQALRTAGFSSSSVLDVHASPNIDLIEDRSVPSDARMNRNGVCEVPVTSVRLMSVKRREEIVNLSPDFLRLDSVREYMEELPTFTVNAHSFSMFIPRLMRETHHGQFLNNVGFMLFKRPFNKLLSSRGVYPLYRHTMAGDENIRWLDYFAHNGYETEFI